MPTSPTDPSDRNAARLPRRGRCVRPLAAARRGRRCRRGPGPRRPARAAGQGRPGRAGRPGDDPLARAGRGPRPGPGGGRGAADARRRQRRAARRHACRGRPAGARPDAGRAGARATAWRTGSRGDAAGLDPDSSFPHRCCSRRPKRAGPPRPRRGWPIIAARPRPSASSRSWPSCWSATRRSTRSTRRSSRRRSRRSLAAPPLNLRQGPFAAAPPVEARAGSDCAGSRCSRWLWSLLTLVVQVATILRYTFAADRLEAEADALAARDAGRRADARPGFGAARRHPVRGGARDPQCRARPGSNIAPDGSLGATLMLDNPATLAALRRGSRRAASPSRPGERAQRRRPADRRPGAAAGMMDGIATWWRVRTQREQRLLLVMFALLALVLGWLLVIRPLVRRAR